MLPSKPLFQTLFTFFWFIELPNSPAIGMQRAGRREYHRLDRDQRGSFSSEDAMR